MRNTFEYKEDLSIYIFFPFFFYFYFSLINLGEHILFFLLQGFFTLIQIIATTVYPWSTIPWKSIPSMIAIPINLGLMLWSSPLFLNPLLREDILNRLSFPVFV